MLRTVFALRNRTGLQFMLSRELAIGFIGIRCGLLWWDGAVRSAVDPASPLRRLPRSKIFRRLAVSVVSVFFAAALTC
jgi:hypothetical protein